MTTASVTPAVRAAAASLRRALLDLAGDTYEISPDDLVAARRAHPLARQRASTAPTPSSPRRSARRASMPPAPARPTPTSSRFRPGAARSPRSRSTPVLGTVIVEKIWAVHDVGRIINPLLASSQVEGGILQGVGYALTEERVIDPTTGAPDERDASTTTSCRRSPTRRRSSSSSSTCPTSMPATPAPRGSASRRSSRPPRRSRTRSRTPPAGGRARCR